MGKNITREQLGELLGYTTPQGESDGTVVQARDADGNVVHEEATNAASAGMAAEQAAEMAPAGGSVAETDAIAALDRRAQAAAAFPKLAEAIEISRRRQQEEAGYLEPARQAEAADVMDLDEVGTVVEEVPTLTALVGEEQAALTEEIPAAPQKQRVQRVKKPKGWKAQAQGETRSTRPLCGNQAHCPGA